MGPYIGDFRAGQTIYVTWDTNDGNGGSIDPTVPGTISVFKDDIAVPTVVGVTDTRNYAGMTGIHVIKIVTIDAFYAIGHDYHIILTAATIDGQIVQSTLARFSIENRYNVLDADLQLHLGAGVGFRNIGNILGQLAQSEFEQRTNVFATIPVPAQNITLSMVNRGCIQYQQVDMSYTKNFAAPDKTFYLLNHYNAQQRLDMVKASLGIVW